MNPTHIRKKLLSDVAFVIEELKRVQVLYGLKKVIRYNHTRQEEQHTESDAEHIYGMHCLVDYFLPLENPERFWDTSRIQMMVQYHELDEIVVGDKVSYEKTTAERECERRQAIEVIKQLPEIMQTPIRDALCEYFSQTTPEARFVKAIDKIEPVFHLYNQTGKETLANLKTKKEEHDSVKYPYVNDFPIIKRFADIMTEQFEKEGYYHG